MIQVSGLNTPSYAVWNEISINIHAKVLQVADDEQFMFFTSETRKARYAFFIQTAYKNVKTTRVCVCERLCVRVYETNAGQDITRISADVVHMLRKSSLRR